ncbi:MAG: gamma-glutamylcyclotransferase [Chloracidobacterium sp.]|nr:gamma-glutamylcyclotransferase [Chloracidobacterium sp.]
MADRFFVYGTLAPGRPNGHILGDVPGTWEPATVRGSLIQEGWGAEVGYPGIVLSDDGDEVHGFIFTSADLSTHWDRLDEFEGDGYERVLVRATLADGSTVHAHIYIISGVRSDHSGGT